MNKLMRSLHQLAFYNGGVTVQSNIRSTSCVLVLYNQGRIQDLGLLNELSWKVWGSTINCYCGIRGGAPDANAF